MDDVLTWIVTPIFLLGLIHIFFGSAPRSSAARRRWGSGWYACREDAERHGAETNPFYDDGPGHYH